MGGGIFSHALVREGGPLTTHHRPLHSTGTGKTAAYSLPIIQKIIKDKKVCSWVRDILLPRAALVPHVLLHPPITILNHLLFCFPRPIPFSCPACTPTFLSMPTSSYTPTWPTYPLSATPRHWESLTSGP